jgi:hypothetical protein
MGTPGFWTAYRQASNHSLSHAFIVSGNVHDSVNVGASAPGYLPVIEALGGGLLRDVDVVIRVDPANGMTFPFGRGQRSRFIRYQQRSPRDAPVPDTDMLDDLVEEPIDPTLPAMTRLTIQKQRDAARLDREKKRAAGKDPLDDVKLPTDIREIVALLNDMIVNRRPVYVPDSDPRDFKLGIIFTPGEFIFPNQDYPQTDAPRLTAVLDWARNMKYGDRGHRFFIVAETYEALHSELRRASARWFRIEHPLPVEDERYTFISYRVPRLEVELEAGLDGLQVARMTGALTLTQVEDLLLLGKGEGKLTRAMINAYKSLTIRQEYEDVIRVPELTYGFEKVFGYAYLKDWFIETVVEPWRENALRVRGLLASGPPGTGKSHIMRACAKEAGVNYIEFDPAAILNMYVGQSERAIARFFRAVQALTPCIVFIDEIDQKLARGGSGAGGGDRVGGNIFGRFLEFMESPDRGNNVLFVAATNWPMRLDNALRDRMDRRAPILSPTEEDRLIIIPGIFALETGRDASELTDAALIQLVAKTDRWANRHIRDLANKSVDYLRRGMSADEALLLASERVRPNLSDVSAQIKEALLDCSDLDLLPPAYQDRAVDVQDREQDRWDADTWNAEPFERGQK